MPLQHFPGSVRDCRGFVQFHAISCLTARPVHRNICADKASSANRGGYSMIRSRALLFGLLACLLTATLLVAGSTPAPSSLTVGDFAVMMASKISPDGATQAITPVQAAEILKKSGVKVETDLASPLTEG